MELETWQAPVGDVIPNHPSFAVLLYRGTGLTDPAAARERFVANGRGGWWVDGVDLLRAADDAARARIAALPAPTGDPVAGDGVAGWR